MFNSKFFKILKIFKLVKKALKLLLCNFQPSIEGLIDVKSKNDELRFKSKNFYEKDNSWNDYLKNIEQEFLNNPSTFLRGKYISKTIHPNEQEKANKLFDEMINDPFSKRYILPYLNESPYGDPFIFEKFRFASPMTIQHAYYLFLINKHLNIFLPKSNIDFISDFGGGYGNFCKLIHQLGYQGKYTIIDFDIMHHIQKKFISHNFSKSVWQNLDLSYINSVSDMNISHYGSNSIFIATYSLCETPKTVREDFENQLKHFKYVFIIYQKNFDGFDNVIYFKSLEKKLIDKGEVKNIYLEKVRSYLFIYQKKNID